MILLGILSKTVLRFRRESQRQNRKMIDSNKNQKNQRKDTA